MMDANVALRRVLTTKVKAANWAQNANGDVVRAINDDWRIFTRQIDQFN